MDNSLFSRAECPNTMSNLSPLPLSALPLLTQAVCKIESSSVVITRSVWPVIFNTNPQLGSQLHQHLPWNHYGFLCTRMIKGHTLLLMLSVNSSVLIHGSVVIQADMSRQAHTG